MDSPIIETQYPISFRQEDAAKLGDYIRNRDSVVLVGMKRVGISNFLRFFLNHQDISKTYIGDNKYLFIPVDLNDLVEREIFPFWALTLKRIVDIATKTKLSQEVRERIEGQFLNSIQSRDLFLVIDSVRQALVHVVDEGYLPTLFFLRFDRMKDAVTPEFFNNIQGLRDATHQKLNYIFTSFRTLDMLSPDVFTRASLSAFSTDQYIRPLKKPDTHVLYENYKEKYKLSLEKQGEQWLFDTVDGYVQYLQLALIFFHETKKHVKSKDELFNLLKHDERITLQSEELWESLTQKEQAVLYKVTRGQKITEEDKRTGKYLWDTGFIAGNGTAQQVFSPLFEKFLNDRDQKNGGESHAIELTKKENLLFNFLKSRQNEICEREELIEHVWPEVESLGVSDWAIDRLVARVRSKLKNQKSKFEIQTIKTRGYKLISIE